MPRDLILRPLDENALGFFFRRATEISPERSALEQRILASIPRLAAQPGGLLTEQPADAAVADIRIESAPR